MPKMTEREKLAELERRQRRIEDEIATARLAVRARYAGIVSELSIECLSEREFREILSQALRTGGPAALTALKALPSS